MNRRILLFLAVSLFLLVIGGYQPGAIAASRTISLDQLGYENDLAVGAPYTTASITFPVPKLAVQAGSTLTLYVSPSPRLNGENLFFVYINGQLVQTPSVNQVRAQRTIVVNIPPDASPSGTIQVDLRTNMYITDDLCRDYYSGGLFFTVHRNSNLNLNYNMLPVRTVADFFHSLTNSVLVVVPDKPSMGEVSGSSWAYGMLKKMYPHINVNLVSASEVSKYTEPRIWVGTAGKLPPYFSRATAGITLVDPNTLLILGSDDAGLKENVRRLADLQIFPANPTATKKITVNVENTPAGTANEAVSFGNIKVQEGILQVPADFKIYPGLLSVPPERLGLHLEGSYTVTFEVVRPVRLDVFFNNNLVHSSTLDETGRFKRDITLPDGIELRSQNSLSIQFNYPEEPGTCRVRGKIQSAQIFTNSYMWGAGRYKFDQFGWPNVGLFFSKKGTILLDDRIDSNIIRAAAEYVALMNRQLPVETYAFPDMALVSSYTDAAAPGEYLAVIAMADKLPEALQEKMPVRIGSNFTVYRAADKTVLYQYQPNTNVVIGRVGQIKDRPLILLTANMSSDLLPTAVRYLSKPSNYEKLTGNVFVYSAPDRLFAFDVRDKNIKVESAGTPASQGMATRILDQNRMPLLLLGGLIVLIIVARIVFRFLFPRKQV